MARRRPADNFPKVEPVLTRTEEEKITQAPLLVKLGGEVYEVKPLVIRESRVWRQKLSEVMGKLPKYTNVTTEQPEEFADAMNVMLVGMPEDIIDLVCAYCKDLPRDAIEDNATDTEMARAFEQIVEVAFPLVGGLTRAMGTLSR